MEFKEEFKKLIETVKKFRKQNNLPYRNEDLAEVLGYNRTYFSALLGDKGKVTQDHIKAIKLHFPILSDNHTSSHTLAQNGTEVQDLHTLIESNATQSQALKVVADTNALLASMLKNSMVVKPIENELEDILSGMTATMRGVVDSLAEIGAGKKFPSVQAAADAIHKHVSEHHRKKLPKRNLHTAGK